MGKHESCENSNANLSLEDIERNPACATLRHRLADGKKVVFRPLARTDREALAEYFLGLSEATRNLYAPHPFDRKTAEAICRELDLKRALRMIASTRRDGEEKIVAYFIIAWGVRDGEKKRYRKAGMELKPGTTCSLAPSVADEYQNRGLGSALLEHVLRLCRFLGRRRMILSGGTRAENVRAIHFYRKAGFRDVAEFHAGGVNNIDMILDLREAT